MAATAEQPNALAGISKLVFDVPQLHGLVYRTAPVVAVPDGRGSRRRSPRRRVYEFNWLSATGTGIFLAAVFSAVLAAHSAAASSSREFVETLCAMRWALADDRLHAGPGLHHQVQRQRRHAGAGVHATGWFYPFFAPLLGWLGVALDRLATLRPTRCSAACSGSRPSSCTSTRC